MPIQRLIVPVIVCAFAQAFTSGSLSMTYAKEGPKTTALDEYVNKVDDSYSWKIISEKSADGIKTIVIEMVSQTWRDTNDVDRPEWRHWLTVTLPPERKSNIGLLFIGGGGNGGKPPEDSSEIIRTIAKATGAVAVELRMVPNQPLVFHNDGQPRTEDDLIAYTWDQFLKTGDPTWPARNPMVKSAVRAMDTITALTAEVDDGGPMVDKFVVAGGSKRGWTTWLTGAVDDRVVAIVPIVIDVLNVEASMRHHFAAYGFWAPSIGDYVRHKIPQRRDHPRMQQLYQLVDPYYYIDRLTMPKFMVNAAGDQFFPPDSSKYYFDDLQGEKYLRYVPNADHGLDGTDAVESVAAFFSLVLAGKKAPQFSWSRQPDGSLQVDTIDRPQEVRLWQANNPKARDFRMESLGPKYTSELLQDQGDGRYAAQLPTPESGWTAYFVELTYPVAENLKLKLTTNVTVLPDVLPFQDKDPNLPTTITLECTAPDAESVASIEKSIGAQEFPGMNGKLVIDARQNVAGAAGVPLRLNWTPQGDFESGARALTKWLSKFHCQAFSYRLESGDGGFTAQ